MSGNWFSKKLGLEQAAPAPAAPKAFKDIPPMQKVPDQYKQGPQPTEGQINVMDAVAQWKGSDAQQLEQESCPGCGGNNYLSRAYTGSQNGRTGRANWKVNANSGAAVPPAKQCMDCNYTDYFEANGSEYDLTGQDVAPGAK